MCPAQPPQRTRHGCYAHLLTVFLLPPGTALFQRDVGMGFELGAQGDLVLWTDVSLGTWNGLGGQGATLALLVEIALDRTDTKAKDACGLTLGPACLNAADNSFS